MTDRVRNFLVSNGLSVEGNQAYGTYMGYETTFFVFSDFPAQLNVHVAYFANQDQRKAITLCIGSLKSAHFDCRFSEFGVVFAMRYSTTSSLMKHLNFYLTRVFDCLKINDAKGVGYCPVCGKELDFDDSKKCTIEQAFVTLDNSCVETINAKIKQENDAYENSPNNYLRGFGGAVLGALAGAVLEILIYFAGYFTLLPAVVAVILGTTLYRKFGGKVKKTMLVIVFVTSSIVMLLAVLGINIASSVELAVKDGVYVSVIDSIRYALDKPWFYQAFLKDMLFTALYVVAGCLLVIVPMATSLRRKRSLI